MTQMKETIKHHELTDRFQSFKIIRQGKNFSQSMRQVTFESCGRHSPSCDYSGSGRNQPRRPGIPCAIYARKPEKYGVIIRPCVAF